MLFVKGRSSVGYIFNKGKIFLFLFPVENRYWKITSESVGLELLGKFALDAFFISTHIPTIENMTIV
jgi:hypothetical protein